MLFPLLAQEGENSYGMTIALVGTSKAFWEQKETNRTPFTSDSKQMLFRTIQTTFESRLGHLPLKPLIRNRYSSLVLECCIGQMLQEWKNKSKFMYQIIFSEVFICIFHKMLLNCHHNQIEGFLIILKEVSYAQQGCIYLVKKYSKISNIVKYLYIVLLLSVSCPVAVILLHCGALSL